MNLSADLPPVELWGYSGELHPLSGGHRNSVFRGGPYVFKSTRRSEMSMRWVRDIQALARGAGFVVPDMIAGTDGAIVQKGWTCESFINGVAFAHSELRKALPIIRAFHEQTRNAPQRPGFLASFQLIDADRGGDVDLSAMPNNVAERCRAAWTSVSDRPRAVVHGDLNPTNLVWSQDGRIALLDWDECRFDLELFDLFPLVGGDSLAAKACAAWEVACSWTLEPDYAQDLAARL